MLFLFFTRTSPNSKIQKQEAYRIFTFIHPLMFRAILIELVHTIMGNAHCSNERLNFCLLINLATEKMATLYIIDVPFVDVNVLFYIF